MLLGLEPPRPRDGVRLRETPNGGRAGRLGRRHAPERPSARPPPGPRAGDPDGFLLPESAAGRRRARARPGRREFADRWTTKLSIGQAQPVRFAAALVGDPISWFSMSRPRASTSRAGATSGWHARRRGAGQDRGLRHPLPRGGGRPRRPDRAHGTWSDRGRRPGDRDQGSSWHRRTIRATLPGADAPALQRLPGVVSAERHGESVLLSASDADVALRALSSGVSDGARHRGARREPRGGIRGADCARRDRNLTRSDGRREGVMSRARTHVRYDFLRTFRNRSLPGGDRRSAARPVFYVVGSANRHTRSDGIAFPLYFMTAMAVYGAMFAVISPGAHIALGPRTRMDSPDAHHAPARLGRRRVQGGHRLPGGVARTRIALPGRRDPRRATRRPTVAPTDRPAARRASLPSSSSGSRSATSQPSTP